MAICCSGCSSGREVWNWSILRAVHYESKYHESERRIRHHEYELARAAWESHQEAHPHLAGCVDFGRGFRDGFAGYLHNGHLDPPSAPPERYRWFEGDGPSEYQATREWFSGYRVGAMAAANSGYRQALLVPAAAPSDQVRRSFPRSGVRLPAPAAVSMPASRPMPEVVPAPMPDEAGNLAPEAFFPEDFSTRERRSGAAEPL